MKKICIISLLIILQNSISAIAQVGTVFSSKDSEGNNLSYKITSENTVMFLGKKVWYHTDKEVLCLPEVVKYKGRFYTVNELSQSAFTPHGGWGKIVLPNTITELPDRLFYSRGFSEIVLPNNLKKIGSLVFEDCKNLIEIVIPESVTDIGAGCFSGCEKLRYVKLPSGINKLETYNNYFKNRFFNCRGFFYLCQSLEEVLLSSNITEIGAGCFMGCSSLKKIVVPDNVEKLESNDESGNEYGCFKGCSNLEEIVLSKKIKEIDKNCFHDCNKLKKIIGLHHGVTIKTALYDFDYKPFLENFESYKADAVHEVYKWQQKRDFESTAEYRARVTPENQQMKVQEYLATAIKEYTDKNKIQVTLGQYDADTEIYTLNSNYGTKYVKVARAEAPAFKENFSNATFDASYVMGDNIPQVSDMSIFVNGKSYRTEKTVVENSNYDLAIDLPDINLDAVQNSKGGNTVKPTTIDRTIDESIPTGLMNNTTTFAVIIGNERYTRVAQVPYANNDARIFAEYCKKTLGLPDKNVKVYENATYGAMIGAVSDIQKIAKAFKGDANIIFYYAGHGIPDEATGDGYLLPIDADGLNMRVCYPLSQLYKELGEMQARSVTCFLDACFSGSQRGDGMVVAARGVAIKAKSDRPTGHTIVFTAATDKQTAYPYKEKGHGMFTYYLLKKLRDTKGDCTLGELGSYICDEVAKQAVVTNGKEQTPVVLTSDGVLDNWKNIKLR